MTLSPSQGSMNSAIRLHENADKLELGTYERMGKS
jgi:hypothetical protein